MMDRRLRDRYSRQTMFPGIGEEGQQKLIESTAVIIGCGALGCSIANFLVRAGVGKIRIVDRDFIEYHNLHRQILFDEKDVKARLPKAIAAQRHLQKVNSSVEIEAIIADVNYTNIESFCRGAQVILDGLDNLETRLLLNDVSLKHGVPWIYGGAVGSSGMAATIIPGETACFRCFTPILPDAASIPTCATAGVIGTVPSIIAAIQATEAMKILIGSEAVIRKLVVMDVWKGTFHQLEIKRQEGCPACQGKYEFLEARFEMKATSLCGQSRAIQVVDTSIKKIDLDILASKLQHLGQVNRSDFMLNFTAGSHELSVFADGRAIIRNTADEAKAKELYSRYVADLVS